MKSKKVINNIVLACLLLLAAVTYAQSDFEKTQNFKTRYKQLEDGIKDAITLEECNTIGESIAKLKKEFINDKALLDKTLYPETFESSFTKIEKALEVRKGDFTQIVELTTEVGTLKTQITEISEKNKSLIAEIRQLNLKGEKDAATIASLQKLVAQLRSNIQQRDMLVRDIVDSLLTQFVKVPSTLNDAEKQNIYSKVEAGNLFYNIERTISDNIQFMRVTELTPEDLSEMKKQHKDFNKVWRQIGPRLADVYLGKQDKTTEIASIDNMFSLWNQRINEEIWNQINKLFREKQISLLQFNNGDQFTTSVVSFIDDEIKNIGVKRPEESENTYYAFTDSVWFQTVQPNWVPILIENKMMTEANKDTIETRIGKWKEYIAPASAFNWYYIILIAVIIVLIIAYLLKGKKKTNVDIPSADSNQ
ncbi:MAG: hypothetical protein AB1521_06915 [Bacteroidota bacterium]